MRNALTFLGVVSLTALFTAGCAGPEQKLGRGINNVTEIARGGELRRSVEQTAVLESPDVGYTTGFIRGVDRTVARTGIGIYEVVTFPLPPYHPIFTRHFTPEPVYPDNYTPGLISDPIFDTDTYVGMSGGDVAPFVPNSRFRVFDSY
jgi:putative exosortase-associated protein (TIGR04073 family)